MKNICIVSAVTVAALFLVAWYVPRHETRVIPTKIIQLNGETVNVAIADTESLRARGLSGTSGLNSDEGMLFIFPADGKYAFWMKDMRFSIDILWISSEGEVINIVERASPSTFPSSFVSGVPARYVLELPAGYVEAHKVRIGGIVRL